MNKNKQKLIDKINKKNSKSYQRGLLSGKKIIDELIEEMVTLQNYVILRPSRKEFIPDTIKDLEIYLIEKYGLSPEKDFNITEGTGYYGFRVEIHIQEEGWSDYE